MSVALLKIVIGVWQRPAAAWAVVEFKKFCLTGLARPVPILRCAINLNRPASVFISVFRKSSAKQLPAVS